MRRYRIKKVRKFTYDGQHYLEYMPQERILWIFWKNISPSSLAFSKAQDVIDRERTHGFGDDDIIMYETPNNKVVKDLVRR